jgi:antitoxin YefM
LILMHGGPVAGRLAPPRLDEPRMRPAVPRQPMNPSNDASHGNTRPRAGPSPLPFLDRVARTSSHRVLVPERNLVLDTGITDRKAIRAALRALGPPVDGPELPSGSTRHPWTMGPHRHPPDRPVTFCTRSRTIVCMEILSVTEARTTLKTLVDRVSGTHERVTLTRNGRAAAVLISPDDLEGLEETISVLSNPDLLGQLAEADAAVEAGDVVDEAGLRALMSGHGR